jgi:hypothetical protein
VLTPGRLADLLADRVEWVTGTRTTEPDLGPVDTAALVVLRSLDLADFASGARAFAAGLDPEERAAWCRSWTRARFLFGNPVNLSEARVVAPGGTAAWLGPFLEAHLPGATRLLKPVSGTLPELPGTVDLPGTGPVRELRVGVGAGSLVDYLVHLHHTLAEAVLFGRLRPEESLRLRHQPQPALDPAESAAYARVLPDPEHRDRLRLHTVLLS